MRIRAGVPLIALAIPLSGLMSIAAAGESPNPCPAAPQPVPPLAPASIENPQDIITKFLGAMDAQKNPVALSMNVEMDGAFKDSNSSGKATVRREVTADGTVSYSGFHFEGDGDVKSWIFINLLKQDVKSAGEAKEARAKGTEPEGALSARNYDFQVKRSELRDGRAVYVLHIDPKNGKHRAFLKRVFGIFRRKKKSDGRTADDASTLLSGDLVIDAATYLPISETGVTGKDVPIGPGFLDLKLRNVHVERDFAFECSKLVTTRFKSTFDSPKGATEVEIRYGGFSTPASQAAPAAAQ